MRFTLLVLNYCYGAILERKSATTLTTYPNGIDKQLCNGQTINTGSV